jgi:hypothetical protein
MSMEGISSPLPLCCVRSLDRHARQPQAAQTQAQTAATAAATGGQQSSADQGQHAAAWAAYYQQYGMAGHVLSPVSGFTATPVRCMGVGATEAELDADPGACQSTGMGTPRSQAAGWLPSRPRRPQLPLPRLWRCMIPLNPPQRAMFSPLVRALCVPLDLSSLSF